MSGFERLAWESSDDGRYVDGLEIVPVDYDGSQVYSGNAIWKLFDYEDIGSPSDFAAAKAWIAELEAQNARLTAELAASRRREEAAKNDIAHNCWYCANLRADGGCKCIPDGDAFSPDYAEGFDRDDCDHWDWRGVAEKKEDAE